jgi:hypothetical protein
LKFVSDVEVSTLMEDISTSLNAKGIRLLKGTFRNTRVISKVLHTALAWPVGWCNRFDFRISCEPHFSEEGCVHSSRLCGPCSAKWSLEMEEENDWSWISRSDQRSYIKIETLGGKTSTKIHNALHEVCRDSVVDRSMVSRWASHFRKGRLSIQDDPRSGRPVTATDDTSVVIVSTLLEEDRRKSCEEIGHEANL